jgi:twitching motility protein PilJ
MPSETDYTQLYEQAQTAYLQADYQEAATLVERLAQEYSDDPHVLLLRGHIYLGLHQYAMASEQYRAVLELTNQPELLEYAQKGLEQAEQTVEFEENNYFSQDEPTGFTLNEPEYDLNGALGEDSSFPSWQEEPDISHGWESNGSNEIDWDSAAFDDEDAGEPTVGQVQSLEHSFESDRNTSFATPSRDFSETAEDNPFGQAQTQETVLNWQQTPEEELPEFPFAQEEQNEYNFSPSQTIGESTFVVAADSQNNRLRPSSDRTQEDFSSYQDEEGTAIEPSANLFSGTLFSEEPQQQTGYAVTASSSNESFLEGLDGLPDDGLDDITRFDLTDVAADFSDSELFTTASADLSGNISSDISRPLVSDDRTGLASWSEGQNSSALGLTGISQRFVNPTVEVQQGKLAKFFNAPLRQKQWITAGAAGLASALAVLLALGIASSLAPEEAKEAKKALFPLSGTGLLMGLVTGAASFGTTLLFGQLATSQIKRSIDDLQNQVDTMTVGNFNIKATIYSEDELGQLAAKFNQMARVIATTTSEAQRRASDMEQAKEDLQRQVIRLLDDVEGAARGDLTVEAEVTADVLGAVADAFNLTIQNLREIVLQVKNAAKQVNKGSTDSELFARNQSSDALRMAEELAVTLNSVQVMTESIQRVAENAREAEEVARSSSVTALKGGEAVERTVGGILQIRETVSETARKVKRLAEASQEISKIVALISQIASRTNLLALNASIQAARAGEAGRGFAIVADEVRQLADRSAKSLKEIEQIVLQIQSETGSVMTAMEEGIQQVIDVTDKSEQAKRSLEDIIEVSNRIDTLVRSITGDTVKQRENSRSVAQVMQAVELTAQETSQESQRVAGSLQNLVSISRELLTSVERFRVEKGES